MLLCVRRLITQSISREYREDLSHVVVAVVVRAGLEALV
jgi:hypothetical protein